MFELLLSRERSHVFDIDLLNEDETGVSLDTGDKARIICYRRAASTPLFNILSGAAATANGSSLTITSTVPTPTGGTPTVRLVLGQADLENLVIGAPYVVDIHTTDANGSPTDALYGPIKGIAYTAETNTASP